MIDPNGKEKSNHGGLNIELSDEGKSHIRRVFLEEIVPRLSKLHARMGNISCEFADPAYKNWSIHFRSRGSDFEIVDFEYDEDAESIDLDL